MGKYEQIQTRKTISAYGGVGSIIETRDGSIIIKPFDEWPFFISIDGNFQEHNNIEDVRFKNRLSKYFINLERLVKIPVNDLKNGFQLQNGDENTIAASYFPEWFYCSSCNKFDKISNWKYNWLNNVEINHRDNFFPPKCYKCYARNRNSKRKFFDLEQVRFILTAPNGDIADIPWDKWSMLKRQKRDNSNSENKEIDTNEETISLSNVEVPSNLVLEYRTSDKLDDLSGINIIAKNDKGETLNFATLSGLFNLRIKNQELIPNTEIKDILFKPVIRSSNSVYYPNILSSIYIPAKDELNVSKIKMIKDLFEKGLTSDLISSVLLATNSFSIQTNTIQRLIDNDFIERDAEITKSENEYRFDEFKYITEKGNDEIKDLLIFDKVDSNCFQNDLIKSIFRMDKIKFTSVQTSYTRQEPISIDTALKEEDIESDKADAIRKKYTSKKGLTTKYLPAIESFGEGIFFEFDNDILDKWINSNELIRDRVQPIINNYHNFDSAFNKDIEVDPKLILIHTFSHLIIKELEYLCGYPSTSIQERIYVSENPNMNGVLIYTIAGSEGSYGGLTSLCDDSKIGKLIQSALTRAKDCATDPICYHTAGQGVGNLNLSACFSCLLLPETSCELFNSFLDRRLLIDDEYGYFKRIYR
ncbi:DrmB family protein [Flavobacterium sp. LS2R12]|uniref:DrmB family protein n=1 Tax=unclassified Flavobacterium TaxID=196869 RepID=UPI003AAC146A